jgi:hypothetical protein
MLLIYIIVGNFFLLLFLILALSHILTPWNSQAPSSLINLNDIEPCDFKNLSAPLPFYTWGNKFLFCVLQWLHFYDIQFIMVIAILPSIRQGILPADFYLHFLVSQILFSFFSLYCSYKLKFLILPKWKNPSPLQTHIHTHLHFLFHLGSNSLEE